MRQHSPDRSRGFTLVELLVVIGIIVALIGILIPVVSNVRIQAQSAATKNMLNQLGTAIEAYFSEYKAYPGPIPNNSIYVKGTNAPFLNAPFTQFQVQPDPAAPTGLVNFPDPSQVTMSENLVLGLCGGLRTVVNSPTSMTLVYVPSAVGSGPMSLADPSKVLPTKGRSFIPAESLSWKSSSPADYATGKYRDDSASADDSIIPEFLDKYSDPMPVIYARAKPGVQLILPSAPGYGPNYNSVVTDNTTSGPFRAGPYDLSQFYPYTRTDSNGSGIGLGKRAPKYYVNNTLTTVQLPYHGLQSVRTTAVSNPGNGYYYPYDLFPYLTNPASSNTARNKDGYILISAGPDHIYGTDDDICSFGAVK